MSNKVVSKIGLLSIAALSLFISFLFLQPIALILDPTFTLLANRGIGKVAFVCMVIYQILLLLSIQSSVFFQRFLRYNVYFFSNMHWITSFLFYFFLFGLFHVGVILLAFFSGSIAYNPAWGSINVMLGAKLIFAFITVFLLAWTEELIFRGTIYLYIEQFYSRLSAALITSAIFMLAHNLSNPLLLITTQWKLGLGVFLLGLFLNLVFIVTDTLYAGMGIHAGLVFVKVFLRRVPCLLFLTIPPISPWFAVDLRQAYLTHLLLAIACVIIIAKYRTKLLASTNSLL